MKQQLRHIKLFELGIAEWPYQTPYEEMKKVVDDNLNGFVIKTSDRYPDSYFYVKDDQVVMEQDQKNDTLWVRSDGFWSIFSNQFSLEYTDIQAIIKFLVEQHLKSNVGTPHHALRTDLQLVEQHLKCNVGTPTDWLFGSLWPVEQHIKSKVGTPGCLNGLTSVEQHLKSNVGSP